MAARDIVVMGASAGGIQTLMSLARELPADLPVSIFLVVHTSPSSPGVLPTLLARAGLFSAEFAIDGEKPQHGRFYVAPADSHLLFRDQLIHLAHGPKENGFRPAVDPLFRTAARNFGPRVVGIVLSGGLDDGTEGLRLIKECGGIAIAQNPEEADFPSMPSSAIRNVAVDHIARIAEIPALLGQYATTELEDTRMYPGGDQPDVAEYGNHGLQNNNVPGAPSSLTCPECGGALWERRNGNQLHFQCHVGHIYTGDGLMSESNRNLEQALWSAVRVMEESAELRRRMARIARNATWKTVAPPYLQQAEELESRAALIRQLLESNGSKNKAARQRKPAGKKASHKRKPPKPSA